MKKLSLIALVAVLFFACGGNKKSKLLVGDWKIADMQAPMPPNMPDSLKGQFEEALKKQIEMMKASSAFSYKADGSFTYNVGEKKGTGTWKLNDAVTELTLSEGEKSDVNKIVELSESKLVFEAPQPDGGGSVTLTLTK